MLVSNTLDTLGDFIYTFIFNILIFWINLSIMPSFQMMLDTGTKPKDKVMLEFRIILSLMLIVVSNAEIFTEHQSELQHHAEVNLNNS